MANLILGSGCPFELHDAGRPAECNVDSVSPHGARSRVATTEFPVGRVESPEMQLLSLGSVDSSQGWLCDLRREWIWRRPPVKKDSTA